MQYRSNCDAKLRVVVSGNAVSLQRKFEHTLEYHVFETEHRLSHSHKSQSTPFFALSDTVSGTLRFCIVVDSLATSAARCSCIFTF